MKLKKAYEKKVLCKKCHVLMVFKREWGDDNKGNCGDASFFECPKCGKTKFVDIDEDENFSYHSG